MCDPITLAIMVAATGASVAGAGIQSREAIDNARRIAKARNERLEQVRTENQKFSDQSRQIFNDRMAEMEGGNVAANLGVAQAESTAGIQGNIPAPEIEAPVGDNAPQVVKSDFAKKMAEAFRQSTERAKAAGKLQGYSGYFKGEGVKDEALARGIGVNSNFAAGNIGILPHMQDMAEVQAFRPSSGLGEALQAIGQVAGGYAGTRTPGASAPKGPTNIVPKGFYK